MTPDNARAAYRREFVRHAETITLRRKGRSDATVRARATGIGVSDVAGATQQNARIMIVLAEDVVRAGFPTPFQANIDRVVWAGRVLTVTYADDTKRRIAGEVIAYELHVSGA